MRQVFNAFPWVLPQEHELVQKLYFRYGRLRKLSKNAILKCGGECNKLFYLKKGLCMYMVNYDREKPRVLALIPPGRAMGDLTCLSGEIVNVTTVAKRESEILVLPPDILKTHMRSSVELMDAVLKTTIAKQESHIEGMIANFTLTPEDRLKTLFKSMICSSGIEPEGMVRLPLKLSHEELGMVVSTTRVTVSRIISKWIEADLIKKDGRSFVINCVLFTGLYDWHNK
ncbi:Crp/Fnr family transcriptional regulator [Seleniivibrio sp.]|uniref:Crp/Fnr family transcriptional regulator n=1 Tax=Seleniivibrio sp. TaxID=2898801 RepID=UPI0025FE0884|nr:Crp/Fnr family transcriptional regulator [Seleniivibrio sp.]MCD8553673.1 Crp/Fnr family transcriptional regulator [Seleniivibrio sp.]